MDRSRDYELLRRFEPVLSYTKGETFLPTSVEDYVARCSLWKQYRDEEPVRLVPEGKLDLETLALIEEQDRDGARSRESVYFLKLAEPLNLAQLAAYHVRERRGERRSPEHSESGTFRAGRGRLARVGYLPRFMDVLFSLTLFVRGRVSGDTAAAAELVYRRMIEARERHPYYGHVVRRGGWISLQYWYFYPFNNWRSGFFGVNDHEADWEMATVFLYENDDAAPNPEWVAYSSHEFHGDDLRRRWDDPELTKVGEHPVVYAAAGSHAGYFASGEYLTELEVPYLSPLLRNLSDGIKLWRRAFRQYRGETGTEEETGSLFRIPFVDYARGDGVSIGEGQGRRWDEANLLDPPPEWTSSYRGLWGLYARDPVAGEDAPAGPMYNRDGTPRKAWYDPIGWAGLDKVPPPNQAARHAAQRRERLEAACSDLQREAEEKSARLADLGTEFEAMSGDSHLKERRDEHGKQMESLSRELDEVRARIASDRAIIEALARSEARLRNGEKSPPRQHLKRAQSPATETNLRFGRIAEAWAAASLALSAVAMVALILFARHYLFVGTFALIVVLLLVESGFRRNLTRLTTRVTVALAIISSLVLAYVFFWQVLVLAVLTAAIYMLSENLRELWR